MIGCYFNYFFVSFLVSCNSFVELAVYPWEDLQRLVFVFFFDSFYSLEYFFTWMFVICLYIFSSWVQTELNDFALKKLAKRHGCPDPIRALIGKKYAFKKQNSLTLKKGSKITSMMSYFAFFFAGLICHPTNRMSNWWKN